MNNNQICNPEKQVPTGIELNEKDYMNSLLTCLKEMSKNYTVAMTEASNETLYNQYKNIFDSIISLQRETYELMFRYGWYKLEKAETQKISDKFTTLSQKLQDLNA